MKKWYLILLLVINAGFALAYDAPDFYLGETCCAPGLSKKECCETSKYGKWCEDKDVCAGNRPNFDCSQLCDEHQLTHSCFCANVTVDVTPSNSPSSVLTFCCRKSDTNKRDCCTSLGYTWIGPNKNSGTCISETAQTCVDIIMDDDYWS